MNDIPSPFTIVTNDLSRTIQHQPVKTVACRRSKIDKYSILDDRFGTDDVLVKRVPVWRKQNKLRPMKNTAFWNLIS